MTCYRALGTTTLQSHGNRPCMVARQSSIHIPICTLASWRQLASHSVPYRMTEANDCLHGVVGASNGYAAALWALDYMHWWAAHHMAGVNFHNNPWLPTDTIVPNPNPCPSTGCENYRTAPKGYGMKAFDLGGHGYVEPITIENPNAINLTAYAVGDAQNLYVTIINKTHNSTKDSTDAAVTIHSNGFKAASCAIDASHQWRPGQCAGRERHLRWRHHLQQCPVVRNVGAFDVEKRHCLHADRSGYLRRRGQNSRRRKQIEVVFASRSAFNRKWAFTLANSQCRVFCFAQACSISIASPRTPADPRKLPDPRG